MNAQIANDYLHLENPESVHDMLSKSLLSQRKFSENEFSLGQLSVDYIILINYVKSTLKIQDGPNLKE